MVIIFCSSISIFWQLLGGKRSKFKHHKPIRPPWSFESLQYLLSLASVSASLACSICRWSSRLWNSWIPAAYIGRCSWTCRDSSHRRSDKSASKWTWTGLYSQHFKINTFSVQQCYFLLIFIYMHIYFSWFLDKPDFDCQFFFLFKTFANKTSIDIQCGTSVYSVCPLTRDISISD